MYDIEKTMNRSGLIKVPEKIERESVYRRVAKFLYIIGVEQAAQVLKNLSQEQIVKVVTELSTIRAVPSDEAERILSEFAGLYKTEKRNTGGVSRAKEMLRTAFGEEKADDIISRSVPEQEIEPFVFLHDIDDQKLQHLLADELPSTVALVLSQLEPKQAAAYITALDDEAKKDIVKRLAKMGEVSREVFNRVHDSLSKKFVSMQDEKTPVIDGRSVLANILKNSDAEFETHLLSSLAEYEPELSTDIERRLLTINDIAHLEGRAFQSILKDMSDIQIATLFVGKKDDFKEKILSQISKHRAQYVKEEADILVASKKDCQTITNDFLNKIRHAKKIGELYTVNEDEEWIR